ncbi:hypothetical protein BDE02_01G159600 [Populus trichocarpa]|nr:hypothetical protein BDE02_01G159600 [Populus trichocarpa]
MCVCVSDLFSPKKFRLFVQYCVESFICFGYGITCGLNVLIGYILMAVMIFSLLFMCTGDVCALINCGQGTCKASNASLLGFECECNSGWKKIEIGPLTFPSCVIPNCTIDLGCGNGASPPPAASQPPPFNLSNPCNLVWCGEGTCVANGTGHICQCNEGSSNLRNETDLACFKQCSFGEDCIGLLLGMLLSPPSVQLPPPPPTPVPPPPPPSSSASPKTNGPTGSTGATSSLRNLHASSMILLAATLLTWL